MKHFDLFIFCGLSLLYLALITPHWNYDVDDAYISYRYAENLREGFELAYNPGERQEGYTSFFWIVLLAFLSVAMPLVYASKFIAILSTLGIGFWFFQISANKSMAWAAFALWLCLPITLMNSMNGMETLLYAFFLTGSVTLALQWLESPSSQKAWLWSLFALLTGLTRPEGNLVTLILTVILGVSSKSRRMLLLPLCAYAGIGALYFIGRILYFNYPWTQPWPNPFLFKVATGAVLKAKGITYVRDFLREPLFPILFFIVYTHFSHQAHFRRFMVTGMTTAGYLCFFFTVEPIVEYFYRFLIPVVPVLLLASLPKVEISKRSLKTSLIVAFFCILMGWWTEWQKQSISGLTAFFSTPLKRTHEPIGKALSVFKNSNYRLGASDAGVLPYYSQWETLDLVGLNYRPYLLQNITLSEFFQKPPTVLVLHDHSQGKPCNIPIELLLTTQGKTELSRYYEQINPPFYHREGLKMAVYLLKSCEDKEALKKKICAEVEQAQQRYFEKSQKE